MGEIVMVAGGATHVRPCGGELMQCPGFDNLLFPTLETVSNLPQSALTTHKVPGCQLKILVDGKFLREHNGQPTLGVSSRKVPSRGVAICSRADSGVSAKQLNKGERSDPSPSLRGAPGCAAPESPRTQSRYPRRGGNMAKRWNYLWLLAVLPAAAWLLGVRLIPFPMLQFNHYHFPGATYFRATGSFTSSRLGRQAKFRPLIHLAPIPTASQTSRGLRLWGTDSDRQPTVTATPTPSSPISVCIRDTMSVARPPTPSIALATLSRREPTAPSSRDESTSGTSV